MVTPTSHPPLPDPRERPDSDVVLYDGECRFCQGQVRRLARWDRGGRLAFLPLQDPRVAEFCPGLTHDQLMQQMHLCTPSGHLYGGAEVLRYLSRALPQLWPLAPLLHLPGSLFIWRWLYRQVARQRYRWGRSGNCDAGSCDIHLK